MVGELVAVVQPKRRNQPTGKPHFAWMTGMVRLGWLITLLMISVVIYIGLMIIDDQPAVSVDHRLSFQDVDRIKRLIQQNNPRRLQVGQVQQVALTERDVNLMLSYVLSRYPWLAAHAQVQQGALALSLTVDLEAVFPGRYLNFSGRLGQQDQQLVLQQLKIGALSLPAWLGQYLAESLHARASREFKSYSELVKAVEDFRFDRDGLQLSYRWQPSLLTDLRAEGGNLLFSEHDKQRLVAYTNRLAAITYPKDPRQPISLFRLLQPLFELAAERTRLGHDAMAENRALIMAFALYAAGGDLRRLLPPAIAVDVKRPRWLRVTLRQRYDLMQHFILSAAVAVSAGGGLADALGLFKELDDSRRGTGFSFADLLADRAGVKLAEMAVRSTSSARLLQQRMLQAGDEMDMMPPIDQLPEGIMELEFKRRYQDLDSDSYQLVESEIARRIAQCSVFRS